MLHELSSLLKHCAASLSKPIYLIFCISLRTSIFPTAWKYANITPIHKGGRSSSVENYRPISLLSSIAKVFEKMVANYITSYLKTKNFIHPSQHGFVKGKSCLTNLLTAINHWTSAIDKRHCCDIIYLDFKKAFDSVDHSILLAKLHKLNLPPFLFHWFASYLQDRRFRVSLRGSFSAWSAAPSGVLQGSVLGPTLFNIFINDLPDHLRYSICLLFADDLKIFRTIKSSSDQQYLQADLDNLAQRVRDNRLSFNVTKSAVLHIGFNNQHINYFLNNQTIPSKDSIKDLGIIVDNKLKFHQQCAAAAKKAVSSAHFIIKSFSFLSSALFSKLYKVFVRPNLEYCVQAWRPFCKKSVDNLEKTQRKITKWCPKLSHLPYERRLQILNLPTLTNRFNRGDLIETYKIMTNRYSIPSDTFFSLSHETRTRGHGLKIALTKFHSDIRKNFFCNRVILPWNKLPESLTAASSVTQWKLRYSTIFSDL